MTNSCNKSSVRTNNSYECLPTEDNNDNSFCRTVPDRRSPYYRQYREDRKEEYRQRVSDALADEKEREKYDEENNYEQVADCEVGEDFSEFEVAEELREFEFAEELAEFEYSGGTTDFEISEGAVRYFDFVQAFADHKDSRELEELDFSEESDDISFAEEIEGIKHYSGQ